MTDDIERAVVALRDLEMVTGKIDDGARRLIVHTVARALRAASASDAGLREPDAYDAGLLGDGGGGDIEWWHGYIRWELERAHDFYCEQALSTPPDTEMEIRDAD